MEKRKEVFEMKRVRTDTQLKNTFISRIFFGNAQ
jgi:hypothetical protein